MSPTRPTRVPTPAPLPPLAPISPFDNHFPQDWDKTAAHEKRETTSKTMNNLTHGNRRGLEQDQLTTQEHPAAQTHQPSSRDTKRKAHNERKIKAWIRSTTPEFDMASTFPDNQQQNPEPAVRPMMKRANSTPLLFGDAVTSRATNLETSRSANVSTVQPGSHTDHDPYRPTETGQPSSWTPRNNIDPALVPHVPSRPGTSMDRPELRPSQLHPARPGTFSRGFSAGDIHSARLGALENPSTTSLASNPHSTPRKSRPSLSNAFNLPRSFAAPPNQPQPHDALLGSDTGTDLSDGSLPRRQPRKQPSLIKGLRGSLFGLLHRGEGEEGRMRRKESKADLRAQVLVDNAAGRGASIDLRSKKSFAYGEGQQDDLSPPLPSPTSHVAAPSPSPSTRPHLRRSSNSAPDDVPQTRLFSPITLHKAYGPSSYKMDKDMPASDSIESLTSPPQRSNSTFAKTSTPRHGLGGVSNGADPMTRKLRSGSDTAAWERKERAAFPKRSQQDIAKRDTRLKSSIQSTVPPTIPARNLTDVFSAPPPVQTNLIPPTVLKHRPRSQSWSASNCLEAASFEVPPIKGLRLQKKRSEPILNAKFTEVQPGHPSIPSRSMTGSLESSLQPVEPLHLRKNESTNRDSQAETRPSLLAYLENRYSRDSNSSSSHLSSTLTNPYDPRLIDNDIYISPTRTVLEDQEAAMKALEDALNGPRSAGTTARAGAPSGWPVVDFGFDGTDHPSTSVTPRPISPKHKVGDSPQLEKYTDVERGQGNEAKPNRAGSVSGLNRTPPREPLPRLPIARTALASSNGQTLNSLGLPLQPPSNHQTLAGSLKKQLVLQEAHHIDPASTQSQPEWELDPSLQLPRLSYSYGKPRSSGRSGSKQYSGSRDSRGSPGRPSLRGLWSLKVEPYSQTRRDSRYTEEDGARQPRLVEVVFPRSAPAARSEFPQDRDLGGSASGQMDREVGASGGGEEEENELGRMKRMWEREKAGKRRLEDELMVLQGKHLGAVSRIARLEQENEQLRRRVSEGMSLPSLPSFGSSTSTTSTMMLLMTPEKDKDRTPGREQQQQQQDQQKQKEMHSRYGSMDTIDRLEVDLGSPFAKRRES